MQSKVFGAFAAAAIAGIWSGLVLVAGLVSGTGASAVALALIWLAPSIPIAAVLGFLRASSAVRSDSIHRPAISIAALAVLLGAPAVSLVFAITTATVDGLLGVIGLTFVYSVIGLIILGWAYLLVAIPSGYVWAAAVRRHAGTTT